MGGEDIMVERIQLVRNVGQFDSVNAGAQLPLSKLTLIYAENGRGKTTLAAILRSLGTNDPVLITERQRLATAHPPQIVITIAGAPNAVFQNGTWSTHLPRMAVFDDLFVSENVCSGVEVEPEHRQRLHELILEAQGVALNSAVKTHIERIEQHNRDLRAKGEAIPAATRGMMTVDAFCALRADSDIGGKIATAERNLAAGQQAAAVQREPAFTPATLPGFDVAAIEALLGRHLPDLDAAAVTRVQAHLATIGAGGEAWIGDGMDRIASASAEHDHDVCPFCAQDLRASPLIDRYRAYFSEEYANLKEAIGEAIAATTAAHSGDVPAAFERSVRVLIQRREFWQAFTMVPEINLDTAQIVHDWTAACAAVQAALAAKQAAPLDVASLSDEAKVTIAKHEANRTILARVVEPLRTVNSEIALVKERAAVADVTTLTADLAKLRATEARHSAAITPLCKAYLDEKEAKAATERLRDQARAELDQYRQTVFPAYEAAINDYLQRFNAGFRLGRVSSVNLRQGSSASYNVVIGAHAVALNSDRGTPAFRNTLSAGDRNTLALAFFFASLDRDPQLAQKIVVIDDPMTSLDEHRSLTTIQEMRRLNARVAQMIVLSHSKSFLCALWQGADTTGRAAILIGRDGAGSAFMPWDVNQDCITEHDKRHALVKSYVQTNRAADERAVAAALRPILESFMRVAHPETFPPGSLLGPFINVCQQRAGAPNQILSATDIAELRDLLEYANKFHHDSNLAWETAAINDRELLGFCEKTLRFASK